MPKDDQDGAPPASMPVVRVTRAQVMAARLRVARAARAGKPVPSAVVAIANARRRPGHRAPSPDLTNEGAC